MELKKNEDFILEAIQKQPDIFLLIIHNKDFSKILKKSSFINKLKRIENISKKFKSLIDNL